MKDFALRATEVFGEARERILSDCRTMHANHSSRGLLRSGMTAHRAIAIFRDDMGHALDRMLSETAKLVEHRGKAWSSAMNAIAEVLETEIASAPELLAPSFRLAQISEGSAASAVQSLVDQAGSDLRRQLEEFQNGWTAPPPKNWTDRHPIPYALMLIVVGSVLGAILTRMLSG